MATTSEWSSKDSIHERTSTTPHGINGTNNKMHHDEAGCTMEPAEALRASQEDGVVSQPITQNLQTNHEITSERAKLLGYIKWFVTDQWFLLAMAAVILLASQVQVPASRQHIKRTVVTYLSVSVIFFINGCTLETSILLANSMRWKLHAFVQLQCYLVCSAATFAIVSLCATNPNFMDPWLLIGFLFVGSAPTTMNSNVVMTRQAHGNTALTVVQSVIGQFLCPFLTPIILQMYLSSGAWYSKVLVHGDGYAEIYKRVFMQLGLSLFVPMFVGQVVQKLFPKQTKKFSSSGISSSCHRLRCLPWCGRRLTRLSRAVHSKPSSRQT
jgi:sodium/bile acid cotransporter 7